MSHPVRVRGLKQHGREVRAYQKQSHPVRVRGLKLRIGAAVRCLAQVAPRAGAWIETPRLTVIFDTLAKSHPVRVRGLKRNLLPFYLDNWQSHPVRVRGLKHRIGKFWGKSSVSHPVRVRGLKRTLRLKLVENLLSHPVRVRGLKQGIQQPKDGDKFVAPRAGAWIETSFSHRSSSQQMRRTPCGCVD